MALSIQPTNPNLSITLIAKMSHTNYPSPRIRLRQIALVAPDLKLAAAQLHAVLDSESVWSDPGVNKFGLDNILVPVGGNIFEVVAPQPGKKNSEIPGGRFMDRLGAKKGAGYMWITMCVFLAWLPQIISNQLSILHFRAPDPVAERARVTSLVVPAEMQQGGNQSGAQKLAAGSGKVQTIRTVAQLDRPDWA